MSTKSSKASSQSPPQQNTIQPYRMHVSQKYLELTRKKLELTRLPREPRNAQQHHDIGVPKTTLEPLIDHWVESYDWRAQESFYNDTMPQFRVPINGTRLHFVHKQSSSPNAVPLLFVHGWPESFITASKMTDALSNPVATPPRGDEDVPSFHVVVPSIPGFGFSDPISEVANNVIATAEVFNTLMLGLGYNQYMCHGTGWGFKICRALALTHPNNCVAIHTVNPDVPMPRSAFDYTSDDLFASGATIEQMQMTPSITPPMTPRSRQASIDRPQTTAYALCDSPPGLLAHIVDAIGDAAFQPVTNSPAQSPQSLYVPTPGRSPISPQTYSPQASRSSRSPKSTTNSPPHLELNDISTVWTPTAIINWTMLYWLPGPEVALRWLVNSKPLVPSLWAAYSHVPLGITHFQEPMAYGSLNSQSPPQWAESFHRIATVRRREGSVSFPAWERPAELVMDIRDFAMLLGLGMPMIPVTNGH